MFKLNSFGQEAAPFELMIAVILMGFVLFVGMLAMNELNKNVCYGKIDKALDDFRAGLEEVINAGGHAERTINLDYPNCFDQRYSVVLKIKREDKAAVCKQVCQGILNECLIIQFADATTAKRKCLNVSPETNFYNETRCKEIMSDLESSLGMKEGRLSLVNFREPDVKIKTRNGVEYRQQLIPFGSYLVIAEESTITGITNVCSFRKG